MNHPITKDGGETVGYESGGNYFAYLDAPEVDDVYTWLPVVIAGAFLLAVVLAAVFFSTRPDPIWPILLSAISF